MSLATRLSAFFLIALALVLVGFSATLHLLARTYLVRQLDERLELALDTLEASVDIEPGGLEWEPTDRQISLGVDPGIDAVRWSVRDAKGGLVDRSANSRGGTFPAGWSPEDWTAGAIDESRYGDLPGWRLAGRRLRLDELLRRGRGHPNDEPGYEKQYRELVLVVGLAPAPTEATLGRLGLTLGTLSVVIWITAAALGWWLLLRALLPVRRMAVAATAITAADPGWRLPAPGTNDELDELGDAFNDLLERLHEAFGLVNDAYEQQRRFAGDASHQLRTPLAALLGQVQVTLRRDRTPEEYRQILEKVHVEGARLRQIVESLLMLAQPEGGRPEPLLVDLRTWLPDQLRRWSEHARASDLAIAIADEGALTIRVHPSLLSQLLDNLLENAFKYSPAGTAIDARAFRRGESVGIDVEDRGPGISAEDAERVFEPFFRTDRARCEGFPGVGLGLAVARRIAARFGGTLDVRSVPGEGSLFMLRLPAAPSDRPVDAEPARAAARSPA